MLQYLKLVDELNSNILEKEPHKYILKHQYDLII